MRYGLKFGRLTVAVALVLLVMILARMVWIQLRSYQVSTGYRALITFNLLHNEHPTDCGTAQIARQQNLKNLLDAGELLRQPGYAWFSAPGLYWLSHTVCQDGVFAPQDLMRYNYLFFGGTVFLATLLVRFLTGSWILSFLVTSILLSRGRMITSLGDLTTLHASVFFVTLWMTCLLHFLRTGAPVTLLASYVAFCLGSFFEIDLLMLGLALPLMLGVGVIVRRLLALPMLQRLRTERRRLRAFMRDLVTGGDELTLSSGWRWLDRLRVGLGLVQARGNDDAKMPLIYRRGSLLVSISVPFLLWVYARRRWLKIIVGGLVATTFAALIIKIVLWQQMSSIDVSQLVANPSQAWVAVLPPWFATWFSSLLEPFDLHLTVSMLVIVLAAIQSPADGLISFFEAAWLSIFTAVILVGGALYFDFVDTQVLYHLEGSVGAWTVYAWNRAPHVFLWLEPVILSLGVAGIYNLLKVGDSWFIRNLH